MNQEKQREYVDTLHLIIPFSIGLIIFVAVLVGLDAIIGPTLTYGGNLCNGTESIVAVCGVPPVGIFVATGIAVVGAHAINNRIIRRLERTADEHGSVVCYLFGHNWNLDPPWSGKELRSRPYCERCGTEPNDIVITGSHEGDHRV